jgi:hypothetical protein
MTLVDRHNQTDCMAHRVNPFNTAWRATHSSGQAIEKYGREVGVVPNRVTVRPEVRDLGYEIS